MKISGLVLLLAVSLGTVPADASKNITIQIMGTDSFCDSYAVTASGGASVFTCVPVIAGGPSGCTATVNSGTSLTLPGTGGNANLAMSCSGGTGLTYNWSRNNVFGASTSASWVDTPASNALLGANNTSVNRTTSYQGRACANSVCVTVPNTALTATVPPISASWAGTCSGYTKTVLLDIDWNAPARLFTTSGGGFDANDIVVVRFTTGSIASSNNLPHLVAVEYGASPFPRTAYLSGTPCALTNLFGVPGAGPMVGNSITSLFAIAPGFGFSYYPILQKNTTYYLNMVNNGGSGCTTGCNMSVDLLKGSL